LAAIAARIRSAMAAASAADAALYGSKHAGRNRVTQPGGATARA